MKVYFTAEISDASPVRAKVYRNSLFRNEKFENLFEDIDLYAKKLGNTPQKQNKTISEVMKQLNDLNVSDHAGDILGDAYEYLIGQFASDSGKKAGEFYTPQAVSHLMTQIVFVGREHQKGMSVYDPTMGFRVIIMIQANSQVNTRVLELLPKFKIKKMNRWCAV